MKLDHSFFNTSEDIHLCGSYIWGDDSPIYNIFNVDLFDILENDICLYETLGCVFICGDFNSRVGDKKDYIVCDKFNSCIDSQDYTSDCIPDRASLDKSLNSNGVKLLDICKGASFRIVNGRIGNSDQYTFLSNNGCSVIDYLLTKESNFSQIQQFYIQRFNEWSDHAPLCFSLLCNNRLHSEEKQSDTKYKWNDSLREQFRSGIIRILPTFNDIVHNINCPDRDSINVLIDKFSNTIRDVADPLFAKDCF